MRFVDTSFWVGLYLRRDAHHAGSLALWRSQRGGLVTTNLVLGETWTFVRRRDSFRMATELIDALSKGPAEAAAQAMREHNAVAMERTLEVLKPYFRMRQANRRTFFRSERKQKLQGIGAGSEGPEVRYQNV